MKKKTFVLDFFGEAVTLALTTEHYSADNTLAVEAIDVDEDEPFATITVNMGPLARPLLTDKNMAFVKNWSENGWVDDFLKAHPEIATPTDTTVDNGFVTARAWQFHPENF